MKGKNTSLYTMKISHSSVPDDDCFSIHGMALSEMQDVINMLGTLHAFDSYFVMITCDTFDAEDDGH